MQGLFCVHEIPSHAVAELKNSENTGCTGLCLLLFSNVALKILELTDFLTILHTLILLLFIKNNTDGSLGLLS